MSTTRILRTAIALTAFAAVVPAARAGEPVLTESAVTEQALVDALRGEDEAPVEVRSRGIRPVQRPPAAAAGSAPPRPSGRASLLITFGVDSAELMPAARQALDVVARALVSPALAARSFVIEGHADPRGDEDRNRRLSLARAQSVVDYLGRAHGLGAGRLSAAGLGSSQLLNRDEPTAAENRRVTIVSR